MLNKISRLITVLGLTTIAISFNTKANAQEISNQLIAQTPPPVAVDVVRPTSPINLKELMNKAFWENSGDFFEQATIDNQLNFFMGWRNFPEGSCPENSIARDGLLINIIVEDYFKQLVEREPTIRTRDIENPFNTSVQQNPSYIRE